MTTDFLLDAQLEGRPELAARAVKPASALDDKRTREKLEIERRVWLEQGIDWDVVTEQNLPPVLIDNLEWLHGPWADDTWTAEETAVVITLTEALPQFGDEPLGIFCAAMEGELSLQSGAVLCFSAGCWRPGNDRLICPGPCGMRKCACRRSRSRTVMKGGRWHDPPDGWRTSALRG